MTLSSLAVRRIDEATEIKIGKALSAGMVPNVRAAGSRVRYLEEMKELQSDAPGAALGQQQGAYPSVTIRIIDSPVENAMVMAGSQLFVTDELLAAVKGENELAFVLGHELGHLYYRDPVKAVGRSLVWISISSLTLTEFILAKTYVSLSSFGNLIT